MQFINSFSNLQLDIVGIVAVLGEGSTLRNAQASALSWHHILPRFLPAPQALLKHEQETRLPTQAGTVVGAYSGNIRFELNFFSQLIHENGGELGQFEVQLVSVEKRKDCEKDPAFGVEPYGTLAGLSVLGCLMAAAVFALSIVYDDGFALMATLLLSATSTTVGVASWWNLNFEEEDAKADRKAAIPDGDVVIYYPTQGAFRVVRCNEKVSRLYFKTEQCKHVFNDDSYRLMALLSTVFLMAGLLFMGNSHIILQMAFAASYILLNILHWGASALKPLKHHWKHSYDVKIETYHRNRDFPLDKNQRAPPTSTASPRFTAPLSTIQETTASDSSDSPANGTASNKTCSTNKVPPVVEKDLEANKSKPPNVKKPSDYSVKAMIRSFTLTRQGTTPKDVARFTDALWTAIALTGSTRWLRSTHIAPDNAVWDQWVEAAGRRARMKWSEDRKEWIPAWQKDKEGHIYLPIWGYQEHLKELFQQATADATRRPNSIAVVADSIFGLNVNSRIRFRKLAADARARSQQRKVKSRLSYERNPLFHPTTAASETAFVMNGS